jgi:hypothetical protein
MVKSILNSAYYKQVVKRFKEKTLYYALITGQTEGLKGGFKEWVAGG